MFPVLSLIVAASLLETPGFLAVSTREDPQRHEIVGVVVDVSSVPIPEAEVSIVNPPGLDKNTHTSKEGRFTIRDLPSGQVSIHVRRLGYEARTVDINFQSELSTPIEIMLKPVPEELEAMLVTDDEKESLREYYEHKATRSSYAKFFDGKDIKKRGVSNASDLFRSVPGVSILSASTGGNSVRIRGCQPMLWVDGERIPRSEIDEVISPGDIAGLEFYISMAGTPAQYMDRSTHACGSILVWTKTR
jgi:hypothetical protein